jgi:hypothetical protein
MTFQEELLRYLRSSNKWVTMEELWDKVPNTPISTDAVGRALRHLRKKGLVVSQKSPGLTHGAKEWSAVGQTVTASNAKPNYTSSLGRIMSSITKYPSLTIAVETVVAEFVTSNKSFSNFDVTKEVRKRSNDNTLPVEASEVGSCYVAGKPVAHIRNDDVKDIVNDLYMSGTMGGFSRVFTGKYFEYGPAMAATVSSMTATDPNGNTTTVTTVVSGSDYDGNSTI